jgi:hypothetical protein
VPLIVGGDAFTGGAGSTVPPPDWVCALVALALPAALVAVTTTRAV